MGTLKKWVLVISLATVVCVMTTGGGCFGPNPVEEIHSERPAAQKPASGSNSAAAPTAAPVKVLEVGNVYGIVAGGKAPSFKLAKPATLVQLTTYHYVAGGGPAPGTIGLKASDGTIVGPFQAKGLDAQGGVKNGFWVADTKSHLEPGSYTVVDSGPSTWSTNSRAKGLGFTTVSVVYDK